MDARHVEALVAFIRERIDDQAERCMRALEQRDLPMEVHVAMSVALAAAENERLLVSRWRAAELSTSVDPCSNRVAAVLELAVTKLARVYRHHPAYDVSWGG